MPWVLVFWVFNPITNGYGYGELEYQTRDECLADVPMLEAQLKRNRNYRRLRRGEVLHYRCILDHQYDEESNDE